LQLIKTKTKTVFMKKVLALLFTALVMSSCSKETIRGNGREITDIRTVDAFTKVKAEGSSNVEIVQGPTQRVEVRGYENLVPVYETFVINGTLILKFRNDYFNINNNNIMVKITVPHVSGLQIEGSGHMYVQGFIGNSLSAQINGSGKINGQSSAYYSVWAKVNGSGDINCAGIQATEAEAEVIGSGKIELSVSDKLKARISGSGDINYYGSPANVDISISGSGHVRKR
jgi:predicted small secreted protein